MDCRHEVCVERKYVCRGLYAKKIPKHYIRRYGVNSLYRYDHPEGFRSCYTLLEYGRLGVCLVILDLRTHPEYDKIFRYRTT